MSSHVDHLARVLPDEEVALAASPFEQRRRLRSAARRHPTMADRLCCPMVGWAVVTTDRVRFFAEHPLRPDRVGVQLASFRPDEIRRVVPVTRRWRRANPAVAVVLADGSTVKLMWRRPEGLDEWLAAVGDLQRHRLPAVVGLPADRKSTGGVGIR